MEGSAACSWAAGPGISVGPGVPQRNLAVTPRRLYGQRWLKLLKYRRAPAEWRAWRWVRLRLNLKVACVQALERRALSCTEPGV